MKQSRFISFLSGSLLLVILFASSCGDDEPTTPSSDLIGTWSLNSVAYTNCPDPDDNGLEVDACTATDCIKWEFKEGGVIEATDIFDGDTDIITGTYSLSGANLTVNLDGDTATGTFTVTTSRFVYNFQDPELNCDVVGEFTRDN